MEYPLGTLLYESASRVFAPRVSPAGDSVAFFELDSTDLWSVVLVDRSGQRQILSKDWADWWNLAWSPDGREIGFAAARAGMASSLYAVNQSGKLRILLSAAGTLVLLDAPTASAGPRGARKPLVNHVLGRTKEERAERDLSWLEGSSAVDLSTDGRKVLLRVTSERNPGRTAVFLRVMDGSSPVHLGYRAAAGALPGRELGAGHPSGHRRRDADRGRQRTDARDRLSRSHRGTMAAGR